MNSSCPDAASAVIGRAPVDGRVRVQAGGRLIGVLAHDDAVGAGLGARQHDPDPVDADAPKNRRGSDAGNRPGCWRCRGRWFFLFRRTSFLLCQLVVLWSGPERRSRRRAVARRATSSARGSRCPQATARDMDGRPAQSTCCLARAHARLPSAADAGVAPGVQVRTRPTGDSVHGNGRWRRGRHRRSHLGGRYRCWVTGLGPAERVRTGAPGAVAGMNRAKRGYVVRGVTLVPPPGSLFLFSHLHTPSRGSRPCPRRSVRRGWTGGRRRVDQGAGLGAPVPSLAATAAARCCTATATSSGELDPAACDSLVHVGATCSWRS